MISTRLSDGTAALGRSSLGVGRIVTGSTNVQQISRSRQPKPRSEFRLLACPSSPEPPKRVPEKSSLKAELQTSLNSEQLQNWPECAIRRRKISVEHGT